MSTDLDCLWSASDFLAFTRHRDDDLRAWAWGRLGLHHPDDAALHVEEGLRDESWSVVGRALHAIVPTAVPHASLDALLLRRDLPRGLRDRASRLRRGEPLPKPAQGELDAEIERLAAAPEELRRRAPELLASASYDDRTLALFALDRQPYRWAAETVLAHVPALLATDSYTLAWETLGELGDPSALQAALDAWRPGDRRLAAVVMRLHLVSGAPAARPMPEQLVRDVEDLASRFRELARRMERFELGTPDSELRLDLRCTGCGRVHEYDVERAVIHPRRSQAAPGWDGVLLGRIVVCKTCGTEDAYELTTRAKAVLVTSEGAGSPVTQEGARVVVGVANLWDGSVAKRPSEAIRHLRALAERYPGRGEGWRRLGNFCERHGRHDEAVAVWTRAAEDEAELEACIVLARELAQTTGTTAQAAFVSGRRIIERLRGGEAGQPADVRRLAAESAFDLISSVLHHVPDSVALTVCWSGGIEGKRAVVNMSSVDLRRVRRWDRLVDLLASASFTSAQLTSELPDPPVTLLARLLESDAPIDGPAGGGLPTRPAVPAREAPKVGRNDPCTCGSGKKYKKCCGR